jgi:hypothetical protein
MSDSNDVRTTWGLTVDCAFPATLAKFWCEALAYIETEPPAGFATWIDWLKHYDVPEDEWGDGAFISDPEGVRPTISFLKVPESKVVKNRMHIDVKVSGGRDQPQELRWPRVTRAVERLVAAGASVVREDSLDGVPDHVVMADPEGNEFCVV